MKLSELFGKEVAAESGGRRGWVRGVLGTAGVPRFLLCFDGEEREFTVDLCRARTEGERIIYGSGAAAKRACAQLRPGTPAFTESGRFLGRLNDIEYNDASARCLIGRKKFRAEDVSFGDVLIVRQPRTLKQDVTDESGVVLKKGAALSGDNLRRAAEAGQYVQAQLKSI